MSKKMKLPSIFKSAGASRHPWRWPSCKDPKTLSFRAIEAKPVVFLEASEASESWFTRSSESASNLSTNGKYNNQDSSGSLPLETIIREVRSSERLFFEPGDTSSILKEVKKEEAGSSDLPFKGSVALELESEDPYLDFKISMQQMVESHGLRHWDRLEHLLGWYLHMNKKTNHGFIVSAFMDLLVGFATDSQTCSSAVCSSDLTPYSSAASSFSSIPKVPV